MLLASESLSLTSDPAWPWSLPPFGLPVLAVVVLLLVGLTVWTYAGERGTRARRVLMVLALRLLALVFACLMLLRPALAFRDEAQPPSALIIVLDASESMTIQDEYDNKSRWERLRRLLQECEPVLQELRTEQNVTVVMYGFGSDVADFDPQGKADGKRTDFGQMLHALYERHGRDRNLRGLLILSDGADNGTRFPTLTEAARWRSLPCPIHTFGLGQPTTADKQRDISFVAINPEPSPVPVKGKLAVRAIIDAPGFENAVSTVHLLIDDKEVPGAQRVTLRKTKGNEVKITTDAPAEPGEIKVTLKVDPLPGEITGANNEISTYVTVTKEGISVLLVDKPRFPEPQFICDALSQDPRIRVFTAFRWSDDAPQVEGPGKEQVDLYAFDKQHYDVIILGDLSPRRLKAGNPNALKEIHDLVKDKGTGLLMMGGYETFGNSDWDKTEIADLLPVELNARGQIDLPVKLELTRDGLEHYIRLAEKDQENADLWERLPKLMGLTRLGAPKAGATVLAVRGGTKEPVLVGKEYGKGRTLAFAGDTTWLWRNLGQPKSNQGILAHAHFWKQLVFWLAQHDKLGGNAYIKPDVRRVAAGDKVGFKVGLRGKGGKELDDARFEVTIVGPQNAEYQVPTAREGDETRGVFWKTDVPGEYHLALKAWPKDADPATTKPEKAQARFIVYQDTTEMAKQAADHVFLDRLASSGGGKFHTADELPRFLQDLHNLPLPQAKPKAEVLPDWRRNGGFLLVFFLLFVAVLCLEWLLRRQWGLV